MKPVRLEFGGMTPMLRSMIGGLIEDADGAEIVSDGQADVLIIGSEEIDGCPGLSGDLGNRSGIGVVTVDPEGHFSTSYRILRQHALLNEDSANSLLGAINFAAGRS